MKKKYKFSNGLAFAEQKDLNMLRKKASQGWMVESFKGGLYKFQKAHPEDVIFSIDYRDLETEESEEYFDMFLMAGWSHVSSNVGIHLFKAVPGTKPLYSDKSSIVEKVKRSAKPIHLLTGFALLVTLLTLALSQLLESAVQSVSQAVFFLSIVFLVPLAMTSAAMFFRLIKAENFNRQ